MITLLLALLIQDSPPTQAELARACAEGTPVVTTEEALFLVEAPKAKHAQLVGDFTDWDARAMAMARSGDVWFVRVRFDPSARIEYQFLVDGEWTLDPRNARKCDNGIGGFNSWLGMPKYAPPAAPVPGAERGKVEPAEVGGHKVWVYLPPGYGGDTRYPSMYFQDGQDYLKRAAAQDVLDALIGAKRIPPIVAVFVQPVERGREYSCDAGYVKFFVEELVPWVDGKYATTKERGLMGASLGGLISVHLTYAHPDLFARVASQSGAFYSDDRERTDGKRVAGTRLFDRIRAAKAHPSRLHVTAGRYEWLLEENRRAHALWEGLKVEHAYAEGSHGHTWTFWAETLPGALEHLWEAR